MDLASILGLVLCIILVIFGIITGDQGVAAIWNFLEYKSAISAAQSVRYLLQIQWQVLWVALRVLLLFLRHL